MDNKNPLEGLLFTTNQYSNPKLLIYPIAFKFELMVT